MYLDFVNGIKMNSLLQINSVACLIYLYRGFFLQSLFCWVCSEQVVVAVAVLITAKAPHTNEPKAFVFGVHLLKECQD